MTSRKKPRGLFDTRSLPYHGERARPGCVLVYDVTGCGEFPFDMLRYDTAIPAYEVDARNMGFNGVECGYKESQRTIRLIAQGCTPKRWESFTWHVGLTVEEKQA